MGLAFCQRVITAFGGRIHCESQAGRYTRFSLLFPQKDTTPMWAAAELMD